MAPVSCVWHEHQGQWVMVAQTQVALFTEDRLSRIHHLLAKEQAPRDELRRYVHKAFRGKVQLSLGIINGREWCEIVENDSLQGKPPMTFSERIHGALQIKHRQSDIKSMLALFNAPVAMLNCRTGRSLWNSAWQRGLEQLNEGQVKALSWAMQQLCLATPAYNVEFGVNDQHGLLLLRQDGQTLGAWRMMLWYKSPAMCVDSADVLALTRSENAVCLALKCRLTVSQIAQLRSVSIHTVRAQLRSVFKKLGVKSQQELLLKLDVAPQILQ